MPASNSADYRDAISFVVVGAFNTLVGLSIIFLLKAGFSANDLLANAVGYALGLALSYVLNARWTFRYDGPLSARVWRYALVIAGAYLANLVTVAALIYGVGMNSYVAQALGVGPYAVVGYLGSKFFAFAGRR